MWCGFWRDKADDSSARLAKGIQGREATGNSGLAGICMGAGWLVGWLVGLGNTTKHNSHVMQYRTSTFERTIERVEEYNANNG